MNSLASPAGGLMPVTITVHREHPEAAPLLLTAPV